MAHANLKGWREDLQRIARPVWSLSEVEGWVTPKKYITKIRYLTTWGLPNLPQLLILP